MSDGQGPDARAAVVTILRELVDGSGPESGWVLNPGDAGLIASLDRLSAVQASVTPVSGGAPIAAHVDHLIYGLSLLVRWSNGEDPFSTADYSASWRRQTVTAEEWEDLRTRLREVSGQWIGAAAEPRDLTEIELNGIVASAAHLAYHMGAIRQIDRSARGPAARD